MHFLHNEVSSEAIQGYLRQGTQIEQLWQQLDEQVTELTLQGMAPWEAHSKLGYALAFARACRLNIVLVQKLVAGADPKSTGFIPRATSDQAQALGELFEPLMEEAMKALDPRYVSAYRLPLRLRRVQIEGRPSANHLLGLLAAGREAREWAAGLVAQYDVAIQAPKQPIPQAIAAHLETMKHQLGLGDFHLESAQNLIGGISDGKPMADALYAQGEGLLWEAIESFYQVSQLVAYPGARTQLAPAAPVPPPPTPAQPPGPVGGVPPALSPGERARIASHVSDMLTQLGPTQPSATSAPSPSGVHDLLNDLQMKAPAGAPPQTSPSAPTLIDQLQTKPASAPTPAPSKPGTPDLLSELQFTAPPQQPSGGAPASGHERDRGQPPTAKKVADLLSELGGEQKDQGTEEGTK
jgi:hypothetical protein